MFAGFYYWSPKWTGVMYNDARQIHFWWSLIAFNVTFFPMHFLGLAGMPRRYADYPMQFADFNAIASGCVFLRSCRCTSSSSSCPMHARARRPAKAPGTAPRALEWEVPSPAPFHTFETPPKLDATATR